MKHTISRRAAIAGAFASKFFFEFRWQVKLGLVLAMLILALFGLFVCPRKPPGKEGV